MMKKKKYKIRSCWTEEFRIFRSYLFGQFFGPNFDGPWPRMETKFFFFQTVFWIHQIKFNKLCLIFRKLNKIKRLFFIKICACLVANRIDKHDQKNVVFFL